MFETLKDLEPEQQEEKPTNYTGLWIGLATLPVMIVFTHYGKDEMGMAAAVYLGMAILAAGIFWNRRRHVWFWVTLALVMALHVLLVIYVPFPGGLHRMELLPIGVADLLIDVGCIKIVEKLTGTNEKTNEDEDP
jgi:hypothetical protein